MPRLFPAALLVFALTQPVAAHSQKAPATGAKPGPVKPLTLPSTSLGLPAAPAQAPKLYPELKPYQTCDFPDGLQVVDVSAMPDDVKERPVKSHGKDGAVPLLAGRRVQFAYPGADTYASVKVELLPEANFLANRKLLTDDFDDIVASDKGVVRNTTRKSPFNGFSINGMDRTSLQGTTLGIYLLIDDHSRIATTIYLLNPKKGAIKTAEDYARMRDTFLFNYTKCIRANQNGVLFGSSK
jgi:hypothetical protein